VQALLLFVRSQSIPKLVWRQRGSRRTFVEIDPGPLIQRIWQAHRSQPTEQSLLSFTLALDGTPDGAPDARYLSGRQKARAGVFDFTFEQSGEVKVTLRGETAWQQLGTPRRPTRPIGMLRPWKPIRVLLNGRLSSYSGQHYVLREYHLVLCRDPAPDQLPPAKLVDLQADLM
jgi:hypothetical protein